MSIELTVDTKKQQYVENVESLYAAINSHYHVEHSSNDNSSGRSISFGRHPIKENQIKFTSGFRGLKAELRIGEVDSKLIETITGHNPHELAEMVKVTREQSGNEVANAFMSGYKPKLDNYFGTDVVSIALHTYGIPKCSLTIDIRDLSDKVVEVVSEILKHSGLTPRADQIREYNL